MHQSDSAPAVGIKTVSEDAKYVIITPVRDERDNIAKTIASVACQTVQPEERLIVDDGSTDGTGHIIDQHLKEFPWIRVIHRLNRGFRKSGAGVIEAFYEGYHALHC